MSNLADAHVSSSLRVLHVIPSVAATRGGPSQAILEMVCALRKIGVEADIATTNDDGNNTLDVPLNSLIDYQDVPIRFFARTKTPINAIREFSYSASFKRWLKKNIDNYDVIHVHAVFSFVSTYTMWLARKRKIAYTIHLIGQLEHWSLSQSKRKKDWYLRLIEQTNIEGASAIHFTAESEREQALQRFSLPKSTVIPLGVTINAPLENAVTPPHWNLRNKVPVVCYLSRLHPKKGLELLLNALSKIDHIDYRLLIAGSGDDDYLKSLTELTTRLELDNKCTFIGFVEGTEKQLLLESSDIFALTSYSENFGIAVLEAMAAGAMPFVSKEVALADIIKKKELGVVCDLTSDDIVNKLKKQLTDISDCNKRGKEAKLYVEQNYQWSNIAEKLHEFYLGLTVRKK